MFRKAVVLLGAMVLLCCWPSHSWPRNGRTIRRSAARSGPGNYLAWYKLLDCWLLVCVGSAPPTGSAATRWSWVTTSACRPTCGTRSPCSRFWSVSCWRSRPDVCRGYVFLLVGYIAPLATYIVMRNGASRTNRRS